MTPSATPHEINANTIYSLEAAVKVLGLKEYTLKREAREGRLRVTRRAGWYWTTGQWLLDWFLAGEREKRNDPDSPEEPEPVADIPRVKAKKVASETPPADAAIAMVVDLWPRLPADIREEIKAMANEAID